MSHVGDVKTQISTYLDELISASVIRSKQVDDYRNGILDRDFVSFPCAILRTVQMEGAIQTDRENLRLFTFEIVIVVNADDVGAGTTTVEDLQEAVLDKFDNNPTFANYANLTEQPAATVAAPYVVRGKTYIVFTVILKIQKLKSLTF